ncbi:MAG: hypothetical protein JWQ30_1555 [Sediminibacterium sp.]|nr:hypothetical protein [Sediminibacterium sp.]
MDNMPTYFNDDGTPLNPDLFSKPQLCLSCKKNDLLGEEEILCNLNRLDQRNEPEFTCYSYDPLK